MRDLTDPQISKGKKSLPVLVLSSITEVDESTTGIVYFLDSGSFSSYKDGVEITNGASSPLSYLNGPIYEYWENGTVNERCMPAPDRVLQYGELWFTPTTLTSTAARSVTLYTGAGFLSQSNVAAATPVQIDNLNGTYSEAKWSGLNLTMPSDGLLQALIWVDDYENGAASPLSGSLDIKLTCAAGTIDYKYSSASFRPGWNTIQLWNPATAADYVCASASKSYIQSNTFNFAQTVTDIAVILNSPATGSKILFAGLWTQTKVKPMIAMTFDVSSTDIFQNFVPAWANKGLKASLRSGGADSYRNISWVNYLKAAYDLGFDVFNGSWSRLNLSQSTTADQFAKEIGLQTNFQNKYGLSKGASLFSSAGNAMPKQSVYRPVCKKLGIKFCKNGNRQGVANFFGPAGLDDTLALTVKGFGGRTAALNQIAGTIYVGGLLMWFGHECPVGGAGYTDAASPGSGGGMWAEDAVYFAEYLSSLVTVGTLDVVSVTDLEAILGL